MNMKNNAVVLPQIIQDQLLSERAFIRFCNDDYIGHKKLDINPDFLRAAEADKFLFPLLQVKEIVKEEGIEKEVLTNYYSPHQIYIITALSKNQVHDGLLWADHDLEFYKLQGFRMVNWGRSGYAFNITLEQSGKGLRVVNQKQIGNAAIVSVEREGSNRKDPSLDHLQDCKDFHNFLVMLHSLEQQEYSYTRDRNKDRHFTDAPSLYFNLTPLKTEGDKILKNYELDLQKLKRVTHNLAGVATDIDPLEHWYYYINRHPQWRKDLFKGDAALAQELYRVYDLLIEAIEAVSGEKQQEMFELMYGQQNINPYLIPRIEYANGTDVKSMWASIKKFKEWSKKEENKVFVIQSTLDWLDAFEKELKDYEERYGARSFISNGVRFVEIEESVRMEDLDPKTKDYLDQ